MTDLNTVAIIGNLTRDAELKYTPGGMTILSFSVANGYQKKSGDQWVDETNFFDVTLFGRLGDAISKYMVKGKKVGVSGTLRQERWEQDGQNRSKVRIIAENVQLLGGANDVRASGGDGDGRPTARNSGQRGGAAFGSADGERFDDDIPF